MTQNDPQDTPPEAQAPVVCADSLDISRVADLRQELLQALASDGPVVLDAAAVERADTAALQLLLAFFNEARGRGVVARWQAPSPALCRAAADLGLVAGLGLAECNPGPGPGPGTSPSH